MPFNLLQDGFVRVAAAVPAVAPGAVPANAAAVLELARRAHADGCDLVVFPELALTGYTCADLFHQDTLLDAAEAALAGLLEQTRDLAPVLVVGLPLRAGPCLFNAAAVLCAGQLLGVAVKSFPPNYGEFYEARWFTPGHLAPSEITLAGATVPCGPDLLFTAAGRPEFVFGVEICEDLWAPEPPGGALALAGAVLLCNPSASDELVGKAAYRRQLVAQQAGRCLAGYVYVSAGPGESTTDVVYGGHALVAENGVLLAEGERFVRGPVLTVADIDAAFLLRERRVNRTFAAAAARHGELRTDGGVRRIPFTHQPAGARTELRRTVNPYPFVPVDTAERDARCAEIFAIQSSGLATRLARTGLKSVTLGVSGGLDSTLALLVCLEAFARLGLDPAGIHAVTMPGFGTSVRTLRNVRALCRRLNLALRSIDIRPACRRHLRDIGHDGVTGDIAYENTQARERTQVLMDLANLTHGLVVGTGDLSELALGWCTYNGDHLSMYAVNTGVPKTLVRFLVAWVAKNRATPAAARVLDDILDTPVSPELLPLDAAGDIHQKTESIIGPYELHDFFLYEFVRRGTPPPKILRLAALAFAGRYEEPEIRRWLKLFISRFFAQQFKRSCLPDGPKVGTVALSPRGDWRMPSDATPELWLAEL